MVLSALSGAGFGHDGNAPVPINIGLGRRRNCFSRGDPTQLGAALIQAETYAHLEELNQQLEALDRTRSNLIAITGHELRTPLSTIQVCLESLNSEPDMPAELREIMLETALGDADRMRKLVQDFLTLSHLESGRVKWNVESLTLQECVDLALSSVRSRWRS